jgi:hypothetical protein
MSRVMRLYYYGVLGAIGGVIGWHFSNMLGLSFTQSVYISEIVIGALIGLCIGISIGLGEGLLNRNLFHALKASLLSGGLGLIGGAVGLPIAEFLFQVLGGQSFSRAFGWAIFGLMIGLAAGSNSGSQIWKGAIGGFIGGIFGSILLDSARNWLQDPLMGKAAGLLLLGTSVGVFIAMIVFLLSKAWLEVETGKLKGTEFILDKFIKTNGPSAFIGSDALKSDIVLPDPDIDPQHALIKGADTHLNIKDMSMSGTFINNRKIEQTSLKNNQKIRMGNTQLIYHEKR